MKYITVIAAMLMLTGCYEDTDVTLHKAGKYKGKADPHALSAEEREQVLKTRFLQVQTDR
jgi:hypothetical protein